ncbi:hypothetical protein, partial [Nocardia farcinica]|uniref:hypothetical protein n=1 Tax=Nocardia farcinica TaxID=37329 RepID=UPI0024560BF9
MSVAPAFATGTPGGGSRTPAVGVASAAISALIATRMSAHGHAGGRDAERGVGQGPIPPHVRLRRGTRRHRPLRGEP